MSQATAKMGRPQTTIPDPTTRDRDFTQPNQVYVPGWFWPKLAFFLFALLVFTFGVVLLWPPMSRLLVGEVERGRIVRLVVTQPGAEDQIYRYRREFDEQGQAVIFQHYIAVEREDGTQQIMRMGVDSRKLPYANVNDEVKVAFFKGDDYAFGVHHHRTWAFGAAYTVVGLVFLVCGIPMLLAVGKPIEVDPENPEALKEMREQEREREQDEHGEPGERGSAKPPKDQ
jgi:hypothetical protein